jgi:hypothetical protein
LDVGIVNFKAQIFCNLQIMQKNESAKAKKEIISILSPAQQQDRIKEKNSQE